MIDESKVDEKRGFSVTYKHEYYGNGAATIIITAANTTDLIEGVLQIYSKYPRMPYSTSHGAVTQLADSSYSITINHYGAD